MHGIYEYLLTVTAAAIICSIAKHITGEKSIAGKITKMISAIFLTITLIYPFRDFRFDNWEGFLDDYHMMASETVQSGVDMAKTAVGDIIKEKTEAYILDEAEKMDMDISVEVKLSDTDPPTPEKVIISGTVSPYKKTTLSQYISNHLDIPWERQQWI